ncbi:polyphosphate kinase 1 [Achromobacter sp. GG226]|uniref:polyphosphate kinase 1 n=1 Tax=Verticiella alkaliphila TaxID=2779529 RepID=UPI001C0D7324|nr:polyphosphate kinase 1 [Verticiella sp. GG226]MBU4609426.1 polyphosphate kinase 1 [Verticiella sp. GG226]
MPTRKPVDCHFLNRELALLKFNERVLALAANPSTPLLERLRFLCIVSANLDEFYEIRVSSLKEQLHQGADSVGEDGMTPAQALQSVAALAQDIVARQYALLDGEILPRLREAGVALHRVPDWTEAHHAWARERFLTDVMPLLTPIALDPAHPFPRVYNKSLNYIVSLSGRDAFGRNAAIAIVQAPRALPRVIRVPSEVSGYPHGYMLLTSLMHAFLGELFPGMQVNGCYQWRVTRNSDLFVDEEEITNLRHALQGELTQRHFGDAVRLEMDANTPPELEAFLQREFGLQPIDSYRVSGPVNLSRLMQIANDTKRPDLLFPEYRPVMPAALATVADRPAELFATIARQDQLLHHPYQSFQPVIDFLTAAAVDPNVVAIKQTIYRTGEDSELMKLLLAAARSGKEVTVVVELMARFDEQTNIHWAARLEEVGAHVVYGVVGHKTHAKMSLVLRREAQGLTRYGHLGTGNYHPRTARLYTDFGLLTANRTICEDMDMVFSQLTGLGERRQLKALLQSPFTMHDTMIAAIRTEIRNAKAGKRARIMAKMNSLLEPTIIQALYEASQAGVRIDLIVRGVCTLRPGVPGLSERITVRSIVGRFLEHSRVYYFLNGGDERVYLSSADWMDRNFFRRVEIATPVLDPKLKKRVIAESFTFALRDTALAWIQDADGNYHRARKRRGEPVNLHQHLMHTLGSA